MPLTCTYCEQAATVLINYNKDPAPRDAPACVDCAAKARRNWCNLYDEKPLPAATRWSMLEID